MGVKGRHRLQGVEDVQASAPGKPDALCDATTRTVLTEPGGLSSELGVAAASLEKSDAFLQRLCAVNREIERQLNIRTAREGCHFD